MTKKPSSVVEAIDNFKWTGISSVVFLEVFAFAIKKHLENKLIVYKNRVIVFS